MRSHNVSSLHLCQRCPRLFAYQLSGKKHVWSIGLVASEPFPGKFFHDKIVKPLHTRLSSTRSQLFKAVKTVCQSPGADFKHRFLETLETEFFLKFMNQHSQKQPPDSLLLIGKAFEKWVEFLSDFLLPIIQNQEDQFHLDQIFYLPEQLISQDYQTDSGEKLTISGQYDAILFDTQKKEIVILECKGKDMSQPDEDLSQIALYAWLIDQKMGIMARGVVIYLTGEDDQLVISQKDMKSTVDNLPHLFQTVIKIHDAITEKTEIILPRSSDSQLCQQCPFNEKCDKDFGQNEAPIEVKEPILETSAEKKSIHEAPAEPEEKDSAHAPNDSDKNQTKRPKDVEEGFKQIITLFNALKLPIFDAGYIRGPRFIRFKLQPDTAKQVTVAKIVKRAEDLQVAMHLKDVPLIQAQAGYISIDIPRQSRIPLTLGDVMRAGDATKPNSTVAFPIGMAIDGTICWIDLNDSGTPSILIGGTSGSGKSILLRSILISLAINATSEELQFTLIDPKHVSFLDLQKIPHIDGDIIVDNQIAINKLNDLVDEMERRYASFKSSEVFDITGYQQKGHQIGHHVVMIDEYADLIIDKQTKTDLETAIQRLGQKGRAAGIHLILATQRPDAKVVTPLIKANLQLKVALKVTTVSNSNIILDQPGAECLIGKGDMLIGGSVPVNRLQGPIPSRDDIEKTALKSSGCSSKNKLSNI